MVQPVGNQIFGAFLEGQENKRRNDAQGIRQLAGVLGIRGALMEQQMAPLRQQLLQAQIQKAMAPESYTLSPGSRRIAGGQVVAEAPFAPKENKGTWSDPYEYNGALVQKNDVTGQIRQAVGRPPENHIHLPQHKPFWDEWLKGEAKGVQSEKQAAIDSAAMISTINTGRELLDSGIISGFGADFLTSAGQALKRAGINYNNDAIANTQAYTAALAVNVGKVIKQFGSGTGLSDADREYAQKIVGGSVNLDEGALRRILDINEKASRNLIRNYNKKATQIQASPNAKMFPYAITVDEPPVYSKKGGKSKAPAGVEQRVWDMFTPEQKALWPKN